MKSPNQVSGLDKAREIGGLVLLLGGIFLFVALATFSPGDLSSISYPPTEPAANKGGRIGAAIAGTLFLHFGVTSYLLTGLLGFWGLLLFLKKAVADVVIKSVAVVLVVLAGCVFASMVTGQAFSQGALSRSMTSLGGLYGDAIARVLRSYLGPMGSYLSLFVFTCLAMVLATDWLLLQGVLAVWKGLAFVTGGALAAGSTGVEALSKSKKLATALWDSRPKGVTRPTVARPMPPPAEDEEEEEDELPPPPAPPRERQTTVERRPAPAREAEPEPRPAPPAPRPAPKPRETRVIIRREGLPSLDLLEESKEPSRPADDRDIEERKETIERTLASFDLEARVVGHERGPVLTMYELEMAAGIRVHRIVGMADDLTIALKAPSVHIVAPIPGKNTIGIEVPNRVKELVHLRDVMSQGAEPAQHMHLPLYLGKDAAGRVCVRDLQEMPHLLIAGTTGSGKSVCLSAIILSLTMNRTPDELKMIMIDPKMVELSMFRDIPHLLAPVVTDMKSAPIVLEWVVRTMEERYELFRRVGVKKIETYNQLGEKKVRERLAEDGEEPPEVPALLPYIVVIIDELADLMMVAAREVEGAITRIAQKSRAVGIHLVLATQRPSVNVITGLIKSNMPARISFKVPSKVDSRTILDRNGAERLLGQGDMLLLLPGMMDLVRAQCTLVLEKEIKDVVDKLRELGVPIFDKELTGVAEAGARLDGEEITDELFDQASRIVLESQRGSVSLLQRKLEIGYTRAARLMDMMAQVGLVGDYKGSKAREVLYSLETWEGLKAKGDGE